MKNIFKINIVIVFLAMILPACKQRYEPTVKPGNLNLLVVEGFLNSGQGSTNIRLSRTVKLEDSAIIKPEQGAAVSVEGENGSNFMLFENAAGEYSTPQLAFENNVKYRLHIVTASGKEYVSDYSPVKYTPPIDSITWQSENDGLRLYANAHDDQNKSKYFEWNYEETWEYHATFYSSLIYTRDNATGIINGIAYRFPDHSVDTTIFKCWKTLNSTSIILGSSEKLTNDRIYLPVQFIEPQSQKLSVLYSINLRQHALSHDAYLFFEKMKRNTEQLGSLFDPQPSEISGNIHCVTDPTELVVGYVEITEEQVKRIFISNSQVPGWGYKRDCFQREVVNHIDSILRYGNGATPTMPAQLVSPGVIKTFYVADNDLCVDCTLEGSNQKPFFWP